MPQNTESGYLRSDPELLAFPVRQTPRGSKARHMPRCGMFFRSRRQKDVSNSIATSQKRLGEWELSVPNCHSRSRTAPRPNQARDERRAAHACSPESLLQQAENCRQTHLCPQELLGEVRGLATDGVLWTS